MEGMWYEARVERTLDVADGATTGGADAHSTDGTGSGERWSSGSACRSPNARIEADEE